MTTITSSRTPAAARRSSRSTVRSYPVDAFDAIYDRKALQKIVNGSQKKNYKVIPRDPKAKSVMV
jgi:hypothetical protein